MLVFNQQANIKNVNGAIADIFANRPAAQSTYYIFYSTDTQEIFYDNGAWILLGSGGGGGVNIYNSDGTLTGNRTLNGANNDLTFADLDVFKTSVAGNDIGLKLDFANAKYQFGDTANFQASLIEIDVWNIYLKGQNNNTFFIIDDGAETIKTNKGGNDIGLKLDFANGQYIFGDIINSTNRSALLLDSNNQNAGFEDVDGTNGLFCDFFNKMYYLGRLSGGNQTYLTINDNLGEYYANYLNNANGLYLSFIGRLFALGDYNNVNTDSYISASQKEISLIGGTTDRLTFKIDGVAAITKTIYQNNDIGLKLDFANNEYSFGDYNNIYGWGSLIIDTLSNGLYYKQNGFPAGLIIVNDEVQLGDVNVDNNQVRFIVSDGGQFITTNYQGNDIGLKLDFANGIYYIGDQNPTFAVKVNTGFGTQLIQLGDFGGDFNGTSFELNDDNQIIQTTNQGNYIGFKLDFANSVYQFGQLTGGNTTYLTIDDAATYPIQIDGTNVLSGSSGSTSGQHLKININGTDYKIELKNP